MAAGGFQSHQIAEAYVELLWKDQQYVAGLAKATAALNTFMATTHRAFTGPGAAAISAIARNVRSLATDFTTLNRRLSAVETRVKANNTNFSNLSTRLRTANTDAMALNRTLAQMKGVAPAMMVSGGGSGSQSAASALMAGMGRVLALVAAYRTGRYFIASPMDLEDKIANLRRITGAYKEATNALAEQVKHAVANMPVDMEQIFGITDIGARMGVDQGSLPMFTRDLTKLSVALRGSGLTAEDAAERIGSMISVFKLGHEDALRFGSALVKLDQSSVATARDILDVSGRMSGPAAIFGMGPAKTLALATALRQAKVPVETAGTAMSQLFMRMASQRDMPAFARLAGMKGKDFQRTLMDDPLAVIERLSKALSKMDAIRGSQALDKLHLDGQRVRGTLIQLAQVWPLLNGYVADAEEQWRTMSEIEDQYNIVAKTTSAQWQIAVNNLKLFAAELGPVVLPAIQGLAGGIHNLTISAREFIKEHKDSFKAFGESVKGAFTLAAVALNDFDLFMRYWKETVFEKFEQGGHLIGEFFSQMGPKVGKFAIEAGIMLGKAFGYGIMFSLKEVMGSLLNYGSSLFNMIPGFKAKADSFMFAMNVATAMSKPNLKMPDFPMFNMGQAMKGMPNRTEERKKIWGDIEARFFEHDATLKQKENEDRYRREAIALLKTKDPRANARAVEMAMRAERGLSADVPLHRGTRVELRRRIEAENERLHDEHKAKVDAARAAFPDLARNVDIEESRARLARLEGYGVRMHLGRRQRLEDRKHIRDHLPEEIEKEKEKLYGLMRLNSPSDAVHAELSDINSQLAKTPAQVSREFAVRMFGPGGARTAGQRMKLRDIMESEGRNRIDRLEKRKKELEEADVRQKLASASENKAREDAKMLAQAKATSDPIVVAVETTTDAVNGLYELLRKGTVAVFS